MKEGFELYKRYRPKGLSEIVGQKVLVSSLTTLLKNRNLPHSLLFSGPSGCGKTTIARILARKLQCSQHDFKEVNAAQFRGIEMIRELQEQVGLSPMGGGCRIWLIDECHQLTAPAQDSFLKLLEDTPNHVYFFLATTSPEKLKGTIKTRCTDCVVKPLTPIHIKSLVKSIAEKEKFELEEEAGKALVEVAGGSARKALVLLDSILGLPAEEQKERILESDYERQAILIARALMNEGTTWKKMASILQKVKEDPEALRWMILGYCNATLLSSKRKASRARAFLIIDAFSENFFDSKKAGLSSRCYDIIENL